MMTGGREAGRDQPGSRGADGSAPARRPQERTGDPTAAESTDPNRRARTAGFAPGPRMGHAGGRNP